MFDIHGNSIKMCEIAIHHHIDFGQFPYHTDAYLLTEHHD